MFDRRRKPPTQAPPNLGNFMFLVSMAVLATGITLSVTSQRSVEGPRSEDYDYVIVGGGAAGAIMAERLSRSGKHSVLLLEAGPDADSDSDLTRIGYWTRSIPSYDLGRYFWQHTQLRQGFGSRRHENEEFARGVPMPSEPDLPSRSLAEWVYSSGRVLGGNSKVNSGVFVRGTDYIFDQWEALTGDTNWSVANVVQAYRELEHYYSNDVDLARRGTSGPIIVTDQRGSASQMAQKLASAYEQLTNLTRLTDYNDMYASSRLGPVTGWQMTADENQTRTSADYSILTREVRRRKNLTIKLAATASRVIFDSKKHARGVEYLRNGHEFIAHAKHRVILTAGINNAAILQRSGVGDMDTLQDAGVPIVQNVSNVGFNLVNHMKVTVTFQKPFTDYPSEEPATVYEGGAFLPDPYGGFLYDQSPRQFQVLATNNLDEMFLSLINLQPLAKGDDEIRSRDPLRVSRVDQVDDDDDGDYDINMMAAAVEEYACKLHAEFQGYGHGPAIDTEYRLVDPPLSICNDTNELRDWVNFNMDPRVFQWSSSCRMGQFNDGESVTNSKGSVWGVSGLTIADRSIMPVTHDGDTSTASYIIAMIIAEQIIAGNV